MANPSITLVQDDYATDLAKWLVTAYGAGSTPASATLAAGDLSLYPGNDTVSGRIVLQPVYRGGGTFDATDHRAFVEVDQAPTDVSTRFAFALSGAGGYAQWRIENGILVGEGSDGAGYRTIFDLPYDPVSERVLGISGDGAGHLSLDTSPDGQTWTPRGYFSPGTATVAAIAPALSARNDGTATPQVVKVAGYNVIGALPPAITPMAEYVDPSLLAPDLRAAVTIHLKRAPQIIAVCGDGGTTDPRVSPVLKTTWGMPKNAIVVTEAGGDGEAPSYPVGWQRIDLHCYGAGRTDVNGQVTPDVLANRERNAYRVWRIAHLVMCPPPGYGVPRNFVAAKTAVRDVRSEGGAALIVESGGWAKVVAGYMVEFVEVPVP